MDCAWAYDECICVISLQPGEPGRVSVIDRAHAPCGFYKAQSYSHSRLDRSLALSVSSATVPRVAYRQSGDLDDRSSCDALGLRRILSQRPLSVAKSLPRRLNCKSWTLADPPGHLHGLERRPDFHRSQKGDPAAADSVSHFSRLGRLYFGR